MSFPFPVTMLLYIPIRRTIHNVVEPILLTVLEGQPMLRVALPPSCQPWQKKLKKPGNDYAQSQPRVNQERFAKSSIGNFSRFNQNRFRLERLILTEHDLNVTIDLSESAALPPPQRLVTNFCPAESHCYQHCGEDRESAPTNVCEIVALLALHIQTP